MARQADPGPAPTGYAAVVLAGGAGRRLGGAAKPALPVGGRPMVDRVLAAVADAVPRVVVGPPELSLPPGVRTTREEPPGGGPVAAAAAGLALVPAGVGEVALLAGDLPLLTTPAVAALRRAVRDSDRAAGAVYLDPGGRRQTLCGLWRAAALRAALDRLAAARGALTGAAMGALVADLTVVGVSWPGAGPPPWFDCDTDADLRRAEEWAR